MESYWIVIFLVVGAAIIFWDHRRKTRRNSTLHQDSNGIWVWTGFDGQERRSATRPDTPGGDWHSESGGGDSGNAGGGGD